MKLIVTERTVYGRKVYGPSNQTAQALATIAGSKTLTKQVLDIAVNDFGAEVIVLHETPVFGKAGV